MKLVVEVELGNAAMKSAGEAVAAIRASLSSDEDAAEPFVVGERGTVRDENGNTVGSWAVVPDGHIRHSPEVLILARELHDLRRKGSPSMLARRAALAADLADLLVRQSEQP